jgi:hypothetical protein
MKKPRLKLVKPTAKAAAPLGHAGQTLWDAIQSEYDGLDAGNAELLRLACLAADRAESARFIIDRDGEIVETIGGPREHALLKCELSNRAFVARTLTRLLPSSGPKKPVGRPASVTSWLGPNSK